MIQRFHRPIATYLSTNHPVLWVARFDVAILLAAGLATVGFLIVGMADATTDALLQRAGERSDQWLANLQFGLQLLTLGLGLAAALLWFGAVYRSAYKAVAPAMRIYPRVIDLFAALAIVGFVTATAFVALDLAMARGAGANSYDNESDPKQIIIKYLTCMVEPAVLLAMVFALMLRWSVAAALAVTVGAAIMTIAGIWVVTEIFGDLLPSESKEVLGFWALLFACLTCLFAPLWIARSPRNSWLRRAVVALCIPMAVMAVAGLEACFMLALERFTQLGYIARSQTIAIIGINREYGPHLFIIIHSTVALLFVQWIYVRWARLSLRPQ